VVKNLMSGEKQNGNVTVARQRKKSVQSISSFFVVFILLLTSFTVMVMIVPDQAEAEIIDGGSWVSPSGYEDPDSDWNDEDEAYDGSTASSAQTTVTWLTWAWTNEIELTHGSMRCTKIKFYAWYNSLYCKEINLDRSNGGSVWSGVYEGSFSDRSWVTKTFSEATMTHARIFFYAKRTIISGTIYPDVFELEFFWLAPTGSTQDPQNVEGTSATFRGYISDTNGKNCEYQFRYGLTSGSYGINPTWESEVGTGYFSKASPTLSKGRMYYYRAYIRNGYSTAEKSDRVVTFSEKTFLTKPDPLTGFTATPFGIGQINLTWSNGAGGDGAYIEYNTANDATWDPGDHIKIDADGYVAGTSFIHDNLEINTSYWYKAWPYAEDDGEKSDGSSTKPYGTATSVVTDSTEDFPGQWFLVDSDNLHSCCEGESPDLEAALDGDGTWGCSGHEEHWFILDLGTNYTVGAVRGRSNYNGLDPGSVDIYVARTLEELEKSKLTKEGSITDWQNTDTWVTHDPEEDLDGRYVKVLITEQDELKFGQTDMLPLPTFSIFDIFVSNCLPEMEWSVNNSTPDMGSSIQFDASESFDQGGSIDSYEWDFDGDGSTDETTGGAVTTHNYNISSIYYPTVTGVDNASSENESQTLTITVKQKISVVKNSKNNGINYITWGANDSIMASKLADDLGMESTTTYIQKFDASTGHWSDDYYTVGEGGDFEINRWDHLRILVQQDRSHSFTPDGVDEAQNVNMDFTDDNNGYYYVTWNQDYSIDPEHFLDNLSIGGGEDITLRVYDSVTNNWKKYYNNLPPIFSDLSIIQPYDVISFNAPEDHANITYNPDLW